jgi:hypothetical protein
MFESVSVCLIFTLDRLASFCSTNPTTLLAFVNADILYVIDPLSLSVSQVLTSNRFRCASYTTVNQVWCACENGHLLLIHMDTQQETEVHLPNSSHATAIRQVNETVWVGTTAGHIYVLDVVTAKLIHSIEFAHATGVTDLVVAGENCVWSSAGGQVCVWSAEHFSCVHAFPPTVRTLVVFSLWRVQVSSSAPMTCASSAPW